MIGLSVLARPLLVDRYLVAAVPAGALLLATVFARLRRFCWLGVAVVLLLTWPAFRATFEPHTPDWRAATSLVLDHGRPADGIVFISNSRHLAEYYWTRDGRVPAPTPLFAPHQWSAPCRVYPHSDVNDVVGSAAEFDRIWVLVRVRGGGYTTEARALVAELTGPRHLAGQWRYGPDILVQLYGRTPAPIVHAASTASPAG